MLKSFGGLIRIARQYTESGVWTLTTLAQYRKYGVTPVRAERTVQAFDATVVTPLFETTFLALQPNTRTEDNATIVIDADTIIKNSEGTIS